ncbi:hypothetical protein BVX98_00965, partial [bacterium F11]
KIGLGQKEMEKVVDIPPGFVRLMLSPNENRILGTRPDDNLWIFDIETTTFTQVAKTRQFEYFPFWSPDGQWVGAQMVTNYAGPYEYHVWHLPTGKRHTLPYNYSSTNLQWWTPLTEPPVDCVKIVEEMLGEGLPLSDLQ